MFANLARLLPIQRRAEFVASSFKTASSLWSKDYYGILAVSKNASPAEVKKAYYQLAKKHHPDRNPDDPKAAAAFQDIAEAYEVLGDPQKRSDYDQVFETTFTTYGNQGKSKSSKAKSGTWKYSRESDPLDLFNKIFGEFSKKFEDIQDHTSFAKHNLPCAFANISLTEAAEGTSRSVRFNITEHKLENEEYLVNIPPGVEDGQTIRLKLRGKIEAIVLVKVDESAIFKRKDCHIHSDLSVNIWDALLGRAVTVQTLYGAIKVKLPKNLSSHCVLELPNQGLKKNSSRNQFGNHYLTIKIKSLDLVEAKAKQQEAQKCTQ